MDMTITNSGRVWMASVLFGAFKSSSPPTPETVLTQWGGSPSGSSTMYTITNGVLKDVHGADVNKVYYISDSYAALALLSFQSNNNTTNHYFAIGSGTTTPSESDYSLEAPITSGATISLAANRGDKKGTYFVTVLNSGSEALTVSEIGFFLTVFVSSGLLKKDVLFARAVLDEAVTLAVGESKTFDVTITF